jgi:pimeloyl-ACP methyl ester carboxylesterase
MIKTWWGLILLTLFFFAIIFFRTQTIGQQAEPLLPIATAGAQISESQTPSPNLWPVPIIPDLREENYHSQLFKEEIVEQTATYQAWRTHFSADSLQESGLLILPQAEAPPGGWPTIILVHGYVQPESYRLNGTPYHHWWQAFVNQGQFAVFKLDLRGHDQSQGQPVGTYYDDGYVRDLLFAYHALQSEPLLNAAKIGLWSHSSAGNLVLRAAVIAQDIPAVSIWGGGIYTYQDFCDYGQTDGSKIPNPASWLATLATNNYPFSQLVERHLQGDCETDLEFWHAFAPTSYLSNLTTTFQIQHSRTDETINYDYARNLNDLLLAANLQVEFNSYHTGDHNFNYILTPALTAMRDFFVRHLIVQSQPPL